MSNPFFKFYRHHWTGNLKLRRCSKLARALWIDILAMTDEDGYVRCTDAEIAQFYGDSLEGVAPLLTELSEAGVLKRGTNSRVLVRQIARDHQHHLNGKKRALAAPRMQGVPGKSADLRASSEVRSQKSESSPSEKAALRAASPPRETKPRKTAEHVRVVELFQLAWAENRHDFAVDLTTPISAIPPEALYTPTAGEWKNAHQVWKLAQGNVELIQARMANLFASDAHWVQQTLSLRLLYSHWPRLTEPLHDLASANGRAG